MSGKKQVVGFMRLKKYGGEFVSDLDLLHQADEMAKENNIK